MMRFVVTPGACLQHMMFHMVDRGYMTSFSWTPSTIVIVILALFTASFVLAWSCFFAVFNDWSYLDAIYFGVVTVTTIGFGDFAPDTGEAVSATPPHLLQIPPGLLCITCSSQ